MTATDELRSVAAKSECANGRCEKLYRGDLERIADRIDAAMEDYIELPKDADGVPIRIGDKMLLLNGESVEVYAIGVGLFMAWNPDDRHFDAYLASKCHHVQPDSWERIIEDATALGAQMNRRTMQVDDLVERCKRLAGGE